MRRVLALVFCSAVLIAGCGSDDEPSAAPAKATATPTQDDGGRGGYGY